ncbi:MAG: hypothetical protein LBK95_14305 [Bifidobacteriaceae bacterium]|nr:hypothetical protein [Bifidobacteriaceae bacterium]
MTTPPFPNHDPPDGQAGRQAPREVETRAKPHPLGLAALIVAAVGLTVACIPATFMAGWALLPVGLALSIAGFFVAGKKWAAVVGLIMCLVTALVSFAMFLWVIADVMIDAATWGLT